MTAPADILIVRDRIAPDDLVRLVAAPFGDRVKFVADIEREVVAIGGELQADAEQVLMIANEMNRGFSLLGATDAERRRSTYDRVLALTDLTIEAQPARGFRRELLRWRDLAAALYASGVPDAEAHRSATRALLLLSGVAARQIPHLRALRD